MKINDIKNSSNPLAILVVTGCLLLGGGIIFAVTDQPNGTSETASQELQSDSTLQPTLKPSEKQPSNPLDKKNTEETKPKQQQQVQGSNDSHSPGDTDKRNNRSTRQDLSDMWKNFLSRYNQGEPPVSPKATTPSKN